VNASEAGLADLRLVFARLAFAFEVTQRIEPPESATTVYESSAFGNAKE
jgi:hypothetical protein